MPRPYPTRIPCLCTTDRRGISRHETRAGARTRSCRHDRSCQERLLRLATRECERRRPRVGAGSRRHERARQGLLPCKAARPLSPIGTNARKKIFCEHRRAPRDGSRPQHAPQRRQDHPRATRTQRSCSTRHEGPTDDHEGWGDGRKTDRPLRALANMGAQMVKEVASSRNEIAHAGTISACSASVERDSPALL